jgi:hypothetical protein
MLLLKGWGGVCDAKEKLLAVSSTNRYLAGHNLHRPASGDVLEVWLRQAGLFFLSFSIYAHREWSLMCTNSNCHWLEGNDGHTASDLASREKGSTGDVVYLIALYL